MFGKRKFEHRVLTRKDETENYTQIAVTDNHKSAKKIYDEYIKKHPKSLTAILKMDSDRSRLEKDRVTNKNFKTN